MWPRSIVQTCIIHLIRNTFRLTSRRDADAIKKDIKKIYTAPNPDAALAALDDLEEKWGKQYRAMIRLWRNAWNEFIPFLDYDVEVRAVICSTNAIESLNARYRRAILGFQRSSQHPSSEGCHGLQDSGEPEAAGGEEARGRADRILPARAAGLQQQPGLSNRRDRSA